CLPRPGRAHRLQARVQNLETAKPARPDGERRKTGPARLADRPTIGLLRSRTFPKVDDRDRLAREPGDKPAVRADRHASEGDTDARNDTPRSRTGIPHHERAVRQAHVSPRAENREREGRGGLESSRSDGSDVDELRLLSALPVDGNGGEDVGAVSTTADDGLSEALGAQLRLSQYPQARKLPHCQSNALSHPDELRHALPARAQGAGGPPPPPFPVTG